MTDFRRFLQTESIVVLPYLGGPYVDARDRQLRVQGDSPPGFVRFRIVGRLAYPLGRGEAPDLSDLAPVRGHTTDGYLVRDGSDAERFALAPDEEPARFAPCRARRWPTGPLLFDDVDYETGIEDDVRAAFAEHRTLAPLSGVPATLRAAFAYAVALRVGRERGIPCLPMEIRPFTGRIADDGDEEAARVLDRLQEERAAARVRPRPTRVAAAPIDDPTARVATALARSSTSLLSVRTVPDDLLEVRYAIWGERFETIVDAATLRVVDAGICVEGHDRSLSLESLPGVVLEAIQRGHLAVTRHG